MESIKPDDIPYLIGPLAKIGIGNACAEPQNLIESLIKYKDAFDTIELYGMIHCWTDRFIKENLWETFKLKVFMVDRVTVEGITIGSTEYIPCPYSGISGLFTNGHIPLDVALSPSPLPTPRAIVALVSHRILPLPWPDVRKSSSPR